MIAHLFNLKTNLELIDSMDVKTKIETYGSINMLVLNLFNPKWVYTKKNNRRNRYNKKLKRGCNHKLVLLNKLEYHKVMLRGSGSIVRYCARWNNEANWHVSCLNFSKGYLYDGGLIYLPFNPKKNRKTSCSTDVIQVQCNSNDECLVASTKI